MKITTFLFNIILLLALGSCQTDEVQLKDSKKLINGNEGIRVDSILTPYIEKLRSLTDNNAGLAIAICSKDSIIYARTFGYANVEEKIDADFNTVFHIASVSKPFTAAAVVKLIQQGKLKLDDYLIDHIPEFKMKGDNYQKITIKHILTHTSGIPRHVSSDDWINPVYGSDALEKNLEKVRDFELDFEPGSEFNYSNSAFDILGIVISRASQMSYDHYITKHILQPSGMLNSHYKKPKGNLPENWAAPHSYGLKTEEWSPYPYSENYFPSSGLQTTIKDMCNWGMLHLNNGQIKGEKVFEEEYFKLLKTPNFNTPWGDKIGLSWFLQSYMDRPIIMHTGNDTGFESNMYIYPKDNIAIVVLANRDFSRTARIMNAASEIFFGAEPKDYDVSAKYKFAEAYNFGGIEQAKQLWSDLKKDTTDIFYVDDDDILTAGAILENRQEWQSSKEILDYYMTIDDQSTYAWRLLGNANINLGDTMNAKSCYEKTLMLNPNYTKGKEALEALSIPRR